MRKIIFIWLAALISVAPMQAQLFQSIGHSQKEDPKPQQQQQQQQTTNNRPQTQSTPIKENKGRVYYVSSMGRARGADGLSPENAKKDLQAVLNTIKENNEKGAVIRVSEGNFLGAANAGYIEINSWVTLEGGWNTDFTERNPLRYITRIEPSQEQLGTNGNKGMIHIKGLDDVMAKSPKGTLIIDGIMLNMGMENAYMPADPKDERNGCPSKAFETGLMQGTPPQVEHRLLWSDGGIAGNVIIRNCMFLNGNNYGILITSRCGEVEICNNVFVCCRYSSCCVMGGDKNGEASHVNFHHNTVAFSWCRDKYMEDMGYGFEYRTYVNADVHHNIFVGSNNAALARTHVLSGPDVVIENKRVTNLYDNYFYLNQTDLQLPSKGGGRWTNVMCSDIEDMVDEKTLPRAENNRRLSEDDAALNAFDAAFLDAFAKLLNTKPRKAILYGNRYNFDKALQLFGAKDNYGAQK